MIATRQRVFPPKSAPPLESSALLAWFVPGSGKGGVAEGVWGRCQGVKTGCCEGKQGRRENNLPALWFICRSSLKPGGLPLQAGKITEAGLALLLDLFVP